MTRKIEFSSIRRYEGKEFEFTTDGTETFAQSVALIIRGRRGRARIVKSRGGKPIFAVFAHDAGRPRARDAIEKFKEQHAIPVAE